MIDLPALEQYRTLRGAFVDCSYDWRQLQNGELPAGRSTMAKPDPSWREGKVSGILGFSKRGYPQFDGDTMLDSCFHKYQNVRIVERFRPAKNAVRMLCGDCGDVRPFRKRSPIATALHPIAECLDKARFTMGQTHGASCKCSVCGATGRKGVWDSFYVVPSSYWWITTDTPHEEIYRALAGIEFDRVMKDATIQMYLTGCDYRGAYGKMQRGEAYELKMRGNHGEYLTGWTDEPPPAGWWNRWLDMEDVRPFLSRLRANDGKEFIEAARGPSGGREG